MSSFTINYFDFMIDYIINYNKHR